MTVFDFPGDPTALRRPRMVVRGGHSAVYDPAENVAAKSDVIHAWQQAGGSRHERGVPLRLVVSCFFRRPASHYGTGRNAEKLKPSAPRYRTSKPDADNILKLICDALQGFAFYDDGQIADARVLTVYGGSGPHTQVRLEALTGDHYEEAV